MRTGAEAHVEHGHGYGALRERHGTTLARRAPCPLQDVFVAQQRGLGPYGATFMASLKYNSIPHLRGVWSTALSTLSYETMSWYLEVTGVLKIARGYLSTEAMN